MTAHLDAMRSDISEIKGDVKSLMRDNLTTAAIRKDMARRTVFWEWVITTVVAVAGSATVAIVFSIWIH